LEEAQFSCCSRQSSSPLQSPRPARAACAAEIGRDADAALWKLSASTPKAKEFAAQAKGILMFPNTVKAGLLVGAQYGERAPPGGQYTLNRE
jgi:lipid-binding SYLF domain-containing protein